MKKTSLNKIGCGSAAVRKKKMNEFLSFLLTLHYLCPLANYRQG